MLTEEQQQLFATAKQAQAFRNEAVRIIMTDVDISVLKGCFIRVLLELVDSRDEYIVARVGGITTGETYGNFSLNTTARTDKYLLLVLPPDIAGVNGTQYQLNSISNSTMTEAEFSRWLERMQQCSHMPPPFPSHDGSPPAIGFGIPTPSELSATAERLLAASGSAPRASHGGRLPRITQMPAGRPPVSAAPPQTQATEAPSLTPLAAGGVSGYPNLTAFSYSDVANAGEHAVLGSNNNINSNGNSNNNISAGGGVEGGPSATAGVSTRLTQQEVVGLTDNQGGPAVQRAASPWASAIPSCPVGANLNEIMVLDRDFDLATRRRVKQDVINKMSQRSVLFPLNVNELKVSQLRLIERDMIEYLEHVRIAISSKKENCVVCMDHVPTVISLPCRHKVLCRLCASSVNTCPVCRSQHFELFEPKEV